MRKKIILMFAIALLVSGCAHLKKGIILRHENFRGHRVPIKADGKGGEYRWVADVPWDKFTIEEKVGMAFKHGGWLSEADIQEIRQKYGVK